MDISKARQTLQFLPTTADEAFKETLAWYEEAFVKFPSHRDSVLTELFQTAIPKDKRYHQAHLLSLCSPYAQG